MNIPADQMEIVMDDDDWNKDIEEDAEPGVLTNLVVYSRDWTVETINNQIQRGNIDLNPRFQRRNAWNDVKRSLLIESLLTNLPVPEIVLAEHPEKKKSFIVIDGKQRLIAITGFITPEPAFWDQPALQKLRVRSELNGLTYETMSTEPALEATFREFLNADVRCTVISNYRTNDVLYDIFYRLNTGSVSLSTQELRQVLHRGPFAEYLVEITNHTMPIHLVLGLDGPDRRLRDAELILRYLAIINFGNTYHGNLKAFLDDSMGEFTQQWGTLRQKVEADITQLNFAMQKLFSVFQSPAKVGRKVTNGRWEGRFNKVLFEVEVFYFLQLTEDQCRQNGERFKANFEAFCSDNAEFRRSIEVTTKTNEQYETRFRLFQQIINEVFDANFDNIPIRVR